MMYTIKNHCVELGTLDYEDGLQFIYFYTNGTKGGGREIRDMLHYLQDSTAANAKDASTRELHEYVSKVKTMPEVRQGYMTFEEYIDYICMDVVAEATKGIRIQNILELLEDYGDIPDQLRKKLEDTEDMELLKNFHKLAAKADSIEAFMGKIGAL